MNKRSSYIQKLWLLSPVPALVLNLLVFSPAQPSNAADADEPRPVEHSVSYQSTQEEQENISVYQRNAPAVISINSGRNQGAGVIIASDGLVVTNKHVIQGASSVVVKTEDGSQYQANLVSLGGMNRDLAFLKINSNRTFPFVRLGDSSSVRVGQRVLAIGSPFGLDGTLTTGIVSRIDKTRNMIQTDAAINPGNSGGPLLNTRGELIGINRSIVNPVGASSAGISFAVPVNVVKQEIASISRNTFTVAGGYNR